MPMGDSKLVGCFKSPNLIKHMIREYLKKNDYQRVLSVDHQTYYTVLYIQ